MKNNICIIAAALFGLVFCFGFSPNNHASDKEKALNTLNQLLEDDIQPVSAQQVKRLSKAEFNAWLKKSGFSAKSQMAIKEDLKPLTSAAAISAVVVKGVKLKNGTPAPDLVLFAIPSGVKFKGWEGIGLILWKYREVIPIQYCDFNKCSNGRCALIIRYGSDCPNDKCKTSQDCGSGGGSLELPLLDAIAFF